jgi:hypothetical protein
VIHYIAQLLHPFFHLTTPFDPLHGDGYQIQSGIAANFGELTLVFGMVGWWHHVNCVTKGCWRKGHRDPLHGHPVCAKHQRLLSSPGHDDVVETA